MTRILTLGTLFFITIASHARAQALSENTKQFNTDHLAFEVATIKPGKPSGMIGFLADSSGRVSIGNANLKMLVHYAFGVDNRQISSTVPLADSTRYDIEALPPTELRAVGGAPRRAWPNNNEREMLRSLLRERFGMRYHQGTTEMNVYLLVRGRGTLTLKEPKDPNSDPRGGVFMKQGGIVDGEARGNNISMPKLAETLGDWVDRLVVDRTGLIGSYDFQVEPIEPGNTEIMVGTQAALHQLGLELKPGKAPMQTMIVDRFTEPTPN